MVGKVVPNYLNNFPSTKIQQGLALSIGSFQNDSNSSWAKYYNYPQTGVTLFYSEIGNSQIFGQQFSGLLFISYNLFNQSVKPFYLKLGLGASYFSTHYDSISNPRNIDVGSTYTWAFQAFLYKTFFKKKGFNLKGGIGFSHASNGHTQLPNLGINSGLISISAQFYKTQSNNYQLVKQRDEKQKSSKSYFLGLRQGIGFQEYGDKDGPVGGAKRKVYSTSFLMSKVANNHFKLIVGITYRYYEQYYLQIATNNLTEYSKNPKSASSNIAVFGGGELLMEHFSIDAELGVNVYKPFYRQFEKDFPRGTQFNSFQKLKGNLQRIFSTRLGVNLFLFNTNKLPKHNFFIGPHIKANFGQADFTEISFGYHYRLN